MAGCTHSGAQDTPKTGPRCFQNGFQNLSHFWTLFRMILGSKMDPELPKNWSKQCYFLGPFLDSVFCWVLELFRCLLGAFLGLLRLFWEASGPQKPEKTINISRFLKMQIFCFLKLFTALLGSSCPLLGPIWSQNWSQNGPQK